MQVLEAEGLPSFWYEYGMLPKEPPEIFEHGNPAATPPAFFIPVFTSLNLVAVLTAFLRDASHVRPSVVQYALHFCPNGAFVHFTKSCSVCASEAHHAVATRRADSNVLPPAHLIRARRCNHAPSGEPRAELKLVRLCVFIDFSR